MTRMSLLLVVILAAFGAYSLYALIEVGYLGIWRAGIANPGAGQVLFDLIVACLLICSWMLKDAREKGRNAWPYIVATAALGSFGPLAYLLIGEFSGRGVEPLGSGVSSHR